MIGIEVPHLNSERFVKVGETQSSIYHSYPFDKIWFQYGIPEYQTYNRFMDPADTQYFSKKENGDYVGIQFAFDAATWVSFSLKMLSCDGTETTVSPSLYLTQFTITGDLAPDGAQLRRAQYNFKIADVIGTATGKYYFLITMTFTDTTTQQYISEPVLVADYHPNTVLIAYSHSVNAYDVIFSNKAPKFNIRIDAELDYETNKIERTVFRNQKAALRGLYARDWRLFKFTAGFYEGIAPYHADKLIKIFKCDTINIENQFYIAEDEAEFDVQKMDPNYPLLTLSTLLAESNPQDSNMMYEPESIFIFDSGEISGYPYAVTVLGLFDGSYFNYLYDYPNEIREVHDTAAELALIAELNVKAVADGKSGTWQIISDKIFFVPGALDNVTSATRYRLTKALEVSYTTGTLKTMLVKFDQPSGGLTVLSAWNGAVSSVVIDAAAYTGTSENVLIVVPTAATHKIFVYTDDLMTSLRVEPSGTFATDRLITGFAGEVSIALTAFATRGGVISNFSFMFLYEASKVFQALRVEYYDTDTINTSDFTVLDTGDWKYFYSFVFENNSLDTAAQDAVFNDYATHILYTYFGLFGTGLLSTRFQSPSAAPSGASSLARTNLTATGYTVLP